MAERAIDPRTWGSPGAWTVEARDVALARTPGFGQRFFAAVFEQLPAAAANVTFLRWSKQPDDLYAVFDLPSGGFGVQVDPDLEYLIVWGPEDAAEYGDWHGDQVPAAVAHVRRIVGGASK